MRQEKFRDKTREFRLWRLAPIELQKKNFRYFGTLCYYTSWNFASDRLV